MKHEFGCIALEALIACGLVACGAAPDPTSGEVGETVQEIVNGQEVDTPEFKAVVSLTGKNCTGTFIHPFFILTAAHCLPMCSSTITSGCTDASSEDAVGDGSSMWIGREGRPPEMRACTGLERCQSPGAVHTVDRVFFARSSDFNINKAPPDVALLHVTTPFQGTPILVMSANDLPSPSNLASRYDETTTTIVGFSDNAGSTTPRRRAGIAAVENDIEADGRAFKIDGHGRPFVGSRGCKGDSGGPALWRDGQGLLTLGGVMSYTDTFFIDACPSERGETGVA